MLDRLDTLSKAELEQLYRLALSLVVVLAQLLDKPCPVVTRDERRRVRAVDYTDFRG